MKLSERSVKCPITVLMATISVIVLGYISIGRLPLTLMPEFSSSSLSVRVDYPSSSPEEVERSITRPLEEVLSTLENLEGINSTSSNNNSNIRVEFKAGTNMDLAALDVRDRIDQVRNRLPEDVDRVTIRRFQSTDSPVLEFALAWSGSRESLFQFTEEVIKRQLERIEGVASVEIRGAEAKQILVELDQGRMEAYNIDLSTLRQSLQANNVNVSGGYLLDGGKKYTLRTVGEFSDVDQIRDLPLRGGQLTLGDVAEIKYGFNERTDFSRLDAKDSVRVRVFKASTANVVTVCEEAKAELARIQSQPEHVDHVKVQIYRDQSGDIVKSLDDLKKAGLYGGVLAMIVLFLFLRKFRSTLIISLAIPVSIMFALAFLYLLRVFAGADITLNIVSFTGLMVAVGMLVDNSVVVLENIFRYKQDKGLSAMEAAIKGSGEVGVAVTASTLTTIAVFTAFLFLPSAMGRYFKDFGTTVAVSLAASLIVALTLIPMISSRLFTGQEKEKHKSIVFMTNAYGRFMRGLLRWRIVSLVLMVALGYASYLLFNSIGRERMPRVAERQLRMNVLMERSMTTRQIADLFADLETTFIGKKQELEVETVATDYNTRNTRRGMYQGNMALYLTSDAGHLSTAEIQEKVRELLPDVPGVEFTFGRRRHFGGGDEMGIQVELRGDDPGVLALYGEEVKERLLRIPELEDVQTTLETGEDEVHIHVDRTKAEKMGVSSQMVARTISSALSTRASSRYKSEDGEIDIVLQLRGAEELTLDELQNTTLENRDGEMIPLYSVIDYAYEKGPLAIQRDDRKAVLSVVGNTAGGVSTFFINPLVEEQLADLGLPPGYSWSMGRDFWRRIQEEEDSSFAMILAVILMYIIMAALFESFVHPLTILCTVPFSVIGVAILFYYTNTTLNNMAYLGILILFGIVVNNGIILVDHINVLRRSGLTRDEAIVQGGMDRLRPILMTAATSLFGLLPLTLPAIYPETFGSVEGRARMWSPVSIAVLGGLTTSTFLTLIILPGFYSYMDDFQRLLVAVGNWVAEPSFSLPRFRRQS